MGTGKHIKRILLCGLCGFLVCSVYGCQKEIKKKETAKECIELKQDTNPKFEANQIRMCQVEKKGEIKYKLEYIPRTDRERFLYWDMSVPYDSIAIVDTEVMYSLYEKIASISKNKNEKILDTKQNQSYGIEQSNTKISIWYISDEKQVQTDQEPDKKATLRIGNVNDKGQYYCAIQGAETQIFLADSYLVDAVLEKKPYEMILKIPYLVNIQTVKEIKIEFEGNTIQMEQKNSMYKLNGKEIAKDAYQNLYSSLLQPSIVGTYKSGTEEHERILRISYKRTSKEYEPYQVNIYKGNEREDIIEVNGKKFFLIQKKEVDNLIKTLEETCQ